MPNAASMTQGLAHPPDPAAVYRQRTADFGALHARLDRRAKQNGNLNLALFFAAFVAVVIGSVRKDESLVRFGRGARHLVCCRRDLLPAAETPGLPCCHIGRNQSRGPARLERNWSALPAPPQVGQPGGIALPSGASIDPATAADLDLLGRCQRATLAQYRCDSDRSGHALRLAVCSLLHHPIVTTRQGAVRELAPLIDFRDDVGASGRQMGQAQPHYETLSSPGRRVHLGWYASAAAALAGTPPAAA